MQAVADLADVSALPATTQDSAGDGAKWKHLADPIHPDRLLGHTEDDASRLVLRDGEGAGLRHFEHAARSVVAHAGHDDADGILACVAGSGTEQHIDRGAVPAHQRTILDFDVVAGAATLEKQVMVPGCNQRASADHSVIGLRFFD